jgi:hypothetical protein
VTEADWLACKKPSAMLAFLRGKAAPRRFRLFTVACVRRVEHLLTDPRSRAAVAVVERYAEGMATPEEMHDAYGRARAAAKAAWDATGRRTADPDALAAAHHAAEAARAAAEAACEESAVAASAVAAATACNAYAGDPAFDGHIAAEHQAQCHLLRCVFGNPFRPPSALDPAVLEANGGAAVKLAQQIYEERALERLPELARALEQAGCADAELLGHLRAPGPHALGCWAVDLVLGKE